MKIELSENDKDIHLSYWHWEFLDGWIERTIGIYQKETNTLVIHPRGLNLVFPMIKALSKWNDERKGGYQKIKIAFAL